MTSTFSTARYFRRLFASNKTINNTPRRRGMTTQSHLNRAVMESMESRLLMTAATHLAFSTGPTDTVAGNPISSIMVSIEDSGNSVVTTDTSSVTLAVNTGPGSTAGTLFFAVHAVNGVATISGLSLTQAGSYTLSATDGALTPAISSSFAITPDAASQLVFTAQPTNGTAGLTLPSTSVSVEDQYGNVVTTDTSAVTVSVSGSNAALSGNVTLNAVNGVATFADLSMTQSGSYQLGAADGALAAGLSTNFSVIPAAATHLAFIAQPSSITAGSTLSTVTVAVEDQYGNVVTSGSANVTLSIGSGNGSLLGTLTASTVNGIATFSSLSIQSADAYTLSAATGGGLTSATSNSFNITAAAASNVVFTQSPSSTSAGALGTVTVSVQDQYGNVVTGNTSNVTVSIASGNGTLLGTTTVAASSGVATFSALAMHTPGSFTLQATDGVLTLGNSSSFTITPAAASQVVFTTQPVNIAAGVLPTVTVAVEDQYGNVVTGNTSNVTLSFASGAGTLGGTLTVAAVGGVATFSDLSVHTPNTFTLGAADGLLSNATSSSFTVSPAAATKLVFSQQPADITAGALGTVTVSVEDQYNNVVTSDTSNITLTISSGGTLLGTKTVAAVNGVATFTGLAVHTAGNFTLGANDGGLVNAVSSSFNVNPAAASQLVFTSVPSSTVAGSGSFATTVAIEDQYGNTVTSSSANVGLAVTTGGQTFNLVVAASSGVATFSGITLVHAGPGSMRATSSGLPGVNSTSFSVTPAAASQVVFTATPVSGTAGATLSTVTAAIEDQYGNVVTTDTSTVTLGDSGPGPFTGTNAVAAINGVATFSNVSLRTAGSYTLFTLDGSLTQASSGSFTVAPAAATKLVFTQNTAGGVAGATLSSVKVSVEDQYNNVVTSDTSNVTLSVSGNATLGGTLTVAAVNGVATFADLSLTQTGTFTLAASDGSLSNGTSSNVSITPAAANHISFTVSPSSGAAGALGNVTVAVRDQYNNVVTTDNSNVTISMASGGGTLLGTATVAAVNGVATFSDLEIHTPGTFTLSIADGALTGATSGSFTITPAAASQVAITTGPTNTIAGQNVSSIVAKVEDQYGNVVTTDSSNVTIALASSNVTLSGTKTVAAVNGVATFSTLSMTTAGTYAVTASDGSLSNATSSNFDITPDAIDQVEFHTLPSDTVAGHTIGTVTVYVEDQYGNLVTSDTGTEIDMTVASGNGTLGGTTAVNDVNGVATFSDLTINTADSYTLNASGGVGANAPFGLTDATTSSFNITPDVAAQLAVTTQPTTTVAGQAASTITVAVEDQYGNVVTTNHSNVTVSVSSGAGSVDGTLTVAAVNGIASFTDLSTVTADNYTLGFADGSLSNTTSSSFTVTSDVADHLAFLSGPTDTVAGQTISSVTVAVEDQYGNVVTTDSSNVTISAMEATVDGTTTVAAVNGIATFSDLSITQATETIMFADDGSLNGDISSPFTIDHDVATQLVEVDGFGGTYSADGLGYMFIVAEDQYGNQINTYTANVTVSINSGNGTLLGTTTVAISNGAAGFLDLAIHEAGTYTLTGTDGVLSDWVSGSFDVTAAAASQLVVTQQPADTTAGALGIVTVAVQDQYGNVVTTDNSNVTLSLNSNGTLGGSLTVAAVNGVATFSDLSLHTVGTYSINATDGSLSDTDTASFVISPAAAAKLAYVDAPAGTTAGALGSVTVAVEDQYGNVVTTDTSNVTLSVVSGPGSMGGTLTVAAVNGIATFSDLSLHTHGDYTISAADSGLTGTTSDSLTITPASPDHVTFINQPTTTIAGDLGTVTVAVEDQYNNIVTADSSNITLTLGGGNATLLGTLTVSANNGTATFSTLALHKVGNYTLSAADGGLTTDTSSAFAITPAASSQLIFTTQPTGGVAGATLASVAVTIEDMYGNVATGDSSTVTLLCNAGVNSFTLNLPAVNGIATFSGFSVTKAGTFTFSATDASLTGATSSNFTITPQAATHLAFLTTPTGGMAGPLGPVNVAIEDQFNNIVTSNSSNVTISLASGNGTLGSTLTAAAVNGVATFSDLYLHTPGSFSLAATGSVTSATTSSFAITPATATQLLITQQPANATAGTLGTITLTLKDQYGNICTNDSSNVTVAIASGPGSLGGTTTVAAVNGVATFSNLALTTAGTYALSFTDGGLSSGATNSFAVTPATASKLAILSGPAGMIAGNVATLTVAVEDAYGNLLAGDTSPVTISISSGNGTLGGTTTVNAINGVATFSDLSLHTAGAYTLGFSDGGLTGATTSSFTVSPAAADHVTFVVSPANGAAGNLNTITVAVRDQYDNLVTTDSSAVTLSISSGNGTLGGTLTVNASNGIATFSNVSLHTPGSFILAATDNGLTVGLSGTFTITPAAATHLAVITGPTDTQAGALGTISIALEDQFNNIVTSSSANMTVTLSSGNATLGGTTTISAANGTATFTNLSITKAGSYTLAVNSGVFTVSTGSFSITPAAATQLVFITPPANTANFNLNTITVAVEDQYGNVETSSNQQVAMTMGSGNVTLGGTTTVTAVNGIATFSDLTIAKSGSYTLNASAVGTPLSNATSSSFNVAAKLAITGQPSTTAAGTLPAITVQIQDTLGNLLSSDNSNVTLAFTSGPSATIGGTLTVQAVNGVATFSDLSLHTPGTYTFTVTDGVIASATTANITVTPAAATKLVLTSGPTNMAAGSVGTLTVAVQDQFGNVVTGNTSNVTVSIGSGNGTITGTTTVQAVNGVATFSNLSLTHAGSYTLTFTDGSLTNTTSAGFIVTPAATSKIVLVTQPDALIAGQTGTFSVALQDQYGNAVSTNGVTIAATVASGNGTITGTTTATTNNGVALFSNISLTKSGSYTLAFTGTSLTAGSTSPLVVTATTATHLLITHEPSDAIAGGSNLVTVAVEDQYGNIVTTDTSAVTIATASGNGPISGTLTVNAVNGVASFSQFAYTKTGSYSVTVSDGSLNSATSTNFAIAPAAANHLVFNTQPSNTSSSAIGTVSVLVEDQYNNLATGDTSNVTLTLGSGAGSLGGTTTAAVQNGVATFNNLTVANSGFFTLTASDASLATATSNGFSVSAKLAITNQPSTSPAGVLPAITVALEDSAGNILTNDNSAVILTITSGPAGSQILGTVTVNAVNGVATFSNAVLPTAGTYTLTASQDSGTTTNSTPITVTPASPAAVAFITTPGSATAGVKMGSFAVQVRDQYGNLVTAKTKTTMTLAVATGAGGTINLKANVVNGVATFSGGMLKKAGNYTFVANFGGITGVSSTVAVGAAAPKSVVFTQQPTSTTSGNPFSVAVRLVDAFGNTVTSSTPVTIALAGKKGTLAGSLTAIATNGIALFSNLSITTPGTFNLKATATGKSATSSRFTVA